METNGDGEGGPLFGKATCTLFAAFGRRVSDDMVANTVEGEFLLFHLFLFFFFFFFFLFFCLLGSYESQVRDASKFKVLSAGTC